MGDVSSPGGSILIDSVGDIEELGDDTGADLTGATVTLTAAGGIGDAGTIETDVDTATSVTATVGDINLKDVAGGLTVVLATASDGSITLETVGGDLLVDDVTAADTITVVSGGALEQSGSDAGSDMTAPTINIQTETGIGGSGVIEIDADVLTAVVRASGDIDLQDTDSGLRVENASTFNGSITVDVVVGDLAVGRIASSDSVTLTSAAAITQDSDGVILAGNDASLTAGTGIGLALVQAGDTATIVAGAALVAGDPAGSILDVNDVVGATMNGRTGGDAVMTAAGTIGTPANCVEVEIGGSLVVGAGAPPVKGVPGPLFTINLCGTVANGGTPLIINTTQGLVIFNGVEFDPRLQRLRGSINEYLDPRGRFDAIIHFPLLDSAIFLPVLYDDDRSGGGGPPEGDTPGDPGEQGRSEGLQDAK